MTFAWPAGLGAMCLLPAMVFMYRRSLRGRAARAAALAAQGFRPTVSATSRARWRHLPYALFGLGLTGLIFSVARPQATVSVPNREGIVVLAFDVSNSMRADDLAPTRLAAAQAAAKAFVDRQPRTIKVGVVAFNDGAVATQQPTNDKDAIKAAIDRMTPSGSTSIGQGLFTSLSLIAGKPIGSGVIDPAGEPRAPSAEPDGDNEQGDNEQSDGSNPDAQGSAIDDIDIGYFGNAAVVVLSDGEDRSELAPTDVAKLASVAGVKVYPIGIGSPGGTVVDLDGFRVSTALDEPLLQQIAETTDGTYFNAADAESLAKVYESIDLAWKREPRQTELTALFAAFGGALLAVGSFISLLLFGRAA